MTGFNFTNNSNIASKYEGLSKALANVASNTGQSAVQQSNIARGILDTVNQREMDKLRLAQQNEQFSKTNEISQANLAINQEKHANDVAESTGYNNLVAARLSGQQVNPELLNANSAGIGKFGVYNNQTDLNNANISHLKNADAIAKSNLAINQGEYGMKKDIVKQQEELAKTVLFGLTPQNKDVPTAQATQAENNLNSIRSKQQQYVTDMSAQNNTKLASIDKQLSTFDNTIATYEANPNMSAEAKAEGIKRLNTAKSNILSLRDSVVANQTKLQTDADKIVGQAQSVYDSTPKTTTVPVPQTDILQQIIKDPKTSNVAKLQAIKLLSNGNDNLSGISGSTKSSVGGIDLDGTSNDGSPIAKARYKQNERERNEELQVAYNKYPELRDMGFTSPKAVNSYIELNYDKATGKPKDRASSSFAEVSGAIFKSLADDDQDTDTVTNIQALYDENKEVFKKLNPSQTKILSDAIANNLKGQSSGHINNVGSGSPSGDAIANIVNSPLGQSLGLKYNY